MFTLTGAVIGFAAMLMARGKAGVATALAVLGIVFGIGSSLVFGWEVAEQNLYDPQALIDFDWSTSNWIAGAFAAAPGVLGALFGRRD